MTRAHEEAVSEANRLIEQIRGASNAISSHSMDEIDSLDAIADRIERSSHDLVVKLRELEHERRNSQEESE
jgi:hypothetical protein